MAEEFRIERYGRSDRTRVKAIQRPVRRDRAMPTVNPTAEYR